MKKQDKKNNQMDRNASQVQKQQQISYLNMLSFFNEKIV
jgi:hypothetical protein